MVNGRLYLLGKFLLICWFLPSVVFAADKPEIRLYKLDCGSIRILDANMLDTTDHYEGGVNLKSACFVIQHNNHYMLWEAGFNHEALKRSKEEDPFQPSIAETITESLQKIGLKPWNISHIAVSNMNFDNIGQANTFKQAKLYMGEADYDFLFNQILTPKGYYPEFIDEWADGKNVVLVNEKTDVFGDGRVVLIPTPGYTKGHISLLVNIEKSGSYLLAGDLWHMQQNYDLGLVSDFAKDMNKTRATMERVKNWAEKNNVKVIIQHDSNHFRELPDLPEYLD